MLILEVNNPNILSLEVILINIIVTGGAGFIGSNFIFYMLAKHPDYRIISVEKYYNAVTCEWYIRAKMELRDDYKRKKGAKRRNE